MALVEAALITTAVGGSSAAIQTTAGPMKQSGPVSSSQDTGMSEQSYFQLVAVNVVLGCWLIYALYFNSRVFGFIISAIISRTTKMDFDLGSFSVSVLSGKIMFRGLYLATTDFSLSIYDGIITFRWWKMFDLEYYQEKAPRLVMDLTTVDIHVYNRCQLYEELAQSFAATKARQINVIIDRRKQSFQQGGDSVISGDRPGVARGVPGVTRPGQPPPNTRRRNVRSVSSKGSGSDYSSHVYKPEAQTVLSGGGAQNSLPGTSNAVPSSGGASLLDDRASTGSRVAGSGAGMGTDVEKGSHHGVDTGSNSNSQRDSTESSGLRVWNAFKDLLAIIQIRACPVRIVFGNELLDYSCVLFSKDCDVKYTSQTSSHESSGGGAGGSSHQQSTASGNEAVGAPVTSCHKVGITMRSETKLSMVPKQSLYESEMNKASNANTIGNFKTYINSEKSPETCVLLHTTERVEMGIKWEMPYKIPLSDSSNFSGFQTSDEANALPPEPVRTIDINFTGHSRVCYCPFIDKKRGQLQKYFFPQNYEPKVPTMPPQPGSMRNPLEMCVNVKFSDMLIDFKFQDKELPPDADMQVFKLKADAAFIKYKMPFTVGPTGYKNTCLVTFKHCRVNSNISEFPSFIRAETIELLLEAQVPLFWNYPQHWKFDVSGRKMSIFYLQKVKQSFASIMADFGSKEKPDLLKFVPMKYKCNLDFEKVEVVCPVHQFNWLTNARSHSKGKKAHSHKETHAGPDINEDLLNSNAFKFINAQKLTGSMDFNFLEFMPALVNHKFLFEASQIDIALHLPDSFPSKHIMKSLAVSMKDLTGFDSRMKQNCPGGLDGEVASGDGLGGNLGNNRMFFERFYTFPSSDATEYIQCGNVSVSVDHKYHPVYYTENGNVSGHNLSLPKRTPKLNLRKLGFGMEPQKKSLDQVSLSNSASPLEVMVQPRFMTAIEPDVLEISVAFDQVVGIAYGTAIKHLYAFVMNIFGTMPMKQFERRSTDKHQGSSKKRSFSTSTASPTNANHSTNQGTQHAHNSAQSDYLGKHLDDGVQVHSKHANEQVLKFYASNRPTNVSVSIPIANVCIYVPEYLRINESCPVARTDLVLLEISSSFKEFRFQLIAAPVTILLPNSETESDQNLAASPGFSGPNQQRRRNFRTPRSKKKLDSRMDSFRSPERNRVTLAGFQLRLQGFSNSLETKDKSVPIEYAWLTEVKFLPLRGKVSVSQLLHLVDCIHSLMFLASDPSCTLERGHVDVGYCMHLQRRNECLHRQPSETAGTNRGGVGLDGTHPKQHNPSVFMNPNTHSVNITMMPDKEAREKNHSESNQNQNAESNMCVSTELLKYRMVRIHVDKIDVNLVEPDLITNINIHPVKVSWCNLHSPDSSFGATFHIENVSLRQFATSSELTGYPEAKTWVESGGLKFGPVFTDVSSSVTNSRRFAQQEAFLRLMDQGNRKMFFLERRSGDSNTFRKLPIGNCGCKGNCAFFGTTMLENAYYEALSIYDMREKAPNLADDFTGEIGGTIGVPMHHKNRKYRFPVFLTADLSFATLKHEGVVNRVTASSKENFRSCSPSIDLEAEKTLTAEANRSEVSSVSTTMTGSPQSVIRHPSASSISSDQQQTLTLVEHSYDSNTLYATMPSNLSRDSVSSTVYESRVHTVPKMESSKDRTLVADVDAASSQTQFVTQPSNFSKPSPSSAPRSAALAENVSSSNSSKSLISQAQAQKASTIDGQSQRDSLNSDLLDKQNSVSLLQPGSSKSNLNVDEDDKSSLTESFKSAVSVITSEEGNATFYATSVDGPAPKPSHASAAAQDGSVLSDTAVYSSEYSPRNVARPINSLIMGNLNVLEFTHQKFQKGSASATSESTANPTGNAKLLAYCQFLLPQVQMECEEMFDEVDSSFNFSTPFAPLADNIVHVDAHGHIKSKVVEPGLDMNIIVERDSTDSKSSVKSSAPAFNQGPQPVPPGLGRPVSASLPGGYHKQGRISLVRTSSQKRTNQSYVSKPGEAHTEVMVRFEEPICALFSPLMMGAVSTYVDCCSAYIKSSHPGNVLFKLHQQSVKSAATYLSIEESEDAASANEKMEARKGSKGNNKHGSPEANVHRESGHVTFEADQTDGKANDKSSEAIRDPMAHSFTFTLNVSEIKFNVLQALVDDTLVPNATQIAGASLLSMRLINLDANFLSKKELVLSPEGNVTENVEISAKSSIKQVEAQMQHLKSDDFASKEQYITNIAQESSQCSFTVVNPKSKAAPGWIMTEGGLNAINANGVKLVGYHDPMKRRSRRSVSVSENDFNQQYQATSTGSLQGPIKDEPSVVKYSDTSQAAAVIDLIWFNVASPANRSTTSQYAGDTPTRDYAAHSDPLANVTFDYNLLTTGTFTIAAWLKQFDEIKDKLKALKGENKMRFASVLTSTLYFFIFAPPRTDFDIRAPLCDFESNFTALARKLRHDYSMRTFIKLFEKLPSADVVVMDYTLQRNMLSLDTLHHALFIMCDNVLKSENLALAGKQSGKNSKTNADLLNRSSVLVNTTVVGTERPKSKKHARRRSKFPGFSQQEEEAIPINIEQCDESEASPQERVTFTTGGDFVIFNQKLQPIGEENVSEADDESEVDDTVDNDDIAMTLDNFDIEKAKPVSSDEAVQRWLINSERGTAGGRQPSHTRIAGGIRQSVLPDGVEVNESNQGARDNFKFSDTMSPGENRDTVSVLSRHSSVTSFTPSEEDNSPFAGLRRARKEDSSDEKESLILFRALLQAVKAYKDNAEQYEFTKIFGREIFVCGRILNFRIDVVSKLERPGLGMKYSRKQKRTPERDPVFYTQNFEVNFSLKEQQSTLRKGTLTRLKDKSQRNSLFIDCLITLAKTTYKLDFSVVKLINQIYCSVQKIHEELGWNKVLKDHEINTKMFGTKPSFDNGSHGRSSGNSDMTEDDEGDDCWIFISQKSQYFLANELHERPIEEGKDDMPGRIVTHVIASWLAAEFCTEIGGLVTRTFFDTINVSYWGRETMAGKRLREVDSNITANIKQLDITVTEAESGGAASSVGSFDQSIMTFIVKNTGCVISSKEKMDKQKRSYIWFNIKDVSLNIPLQPAALRQTVDKTSRRITELKSKLPPMPQSGNATGVSPKEQGASQRSGLNMAAGVRGQCDEVDAEDGCFRQQSETEAPQVPIKTLQCESLRETIFKARLDQLEIKTALLVDFTAAYQLTNLRAFGKNSRNIEFDVILDNHFLQFQSGAEPANLMFPNICLEGIYVPIVKANNKGGYVKINQCHRAYEGGNFLILAVNVAKLEEQLSSDLLNHFIIVQEVFRSEVREVISKVSENSAPSGWNIVQSTAGKPPDNTLRSFSSDRGPNMRAVDEIFDDSPPFMLHAKFTMDTLRVTATTPTNNAVQFILDSIEVEVFNFPNGDVYMKRNKRLMTMLARGKMSVDVSLGIIKNVFAKTVYESVGGDPSSPHLEAEEDNRAGLEKKAFVTFAVDFENSAKEATDDESSQAVQVTISKFKLYLEPEAIEHTFKIYINYKNAFEYFTLERQKRNFNASAYNNLYQRDSTQLSTFASPSKKGSEKSNEIGTALSVTSTAAAAAIPPPPGSASSTAESSNPSRLYFLFVIQDLAICIPLESSNKFAWKDDDLEQVLMLTIKRTSVSTVSHSGLFCVGTFKTFTLGFREDFDTKSSNWMLDKIEESFAQPQKPAKPFGYTHFTATPQTPPSYVMNTFWVPEGSVEVVSRTKTLPNPSAGAVWELSIRWQMKGLHVRFDTKLGKWLVMLKNTLTMISDDLTEEESDNEDEADDSSFIRGDDRKKYQEQQKIVMKLKGDKSKANSTRIAAEEYTLKFMEDKQAKQQIKNLKRRTSMVASGAPQLSNANNPNADVGARQQRKTVTGLGQPRQSSLPGSELKSYLRNRASTVSGPGSPLAHLPLAPGFGVGNLPVIAGSPTGSIGGLITSSSNVGLGLGHNRAQSLALGTFSADLSPMGGNTLANSLSQQTVSGGGGNTQMFKPLRTGNAVGSVSNTNKWSDDDDDDDKDQLDTCDKHDVKMDYSTSQPYSSSYMSRQPSRVSYDLKSHSPPHQVNPTPPEDPPPVEVNNVNKNKPENDDKSGKSDDKLNQSSRPTTLFMRSNQHNAPKGMGMRFDLDISISSGECVLHADPPVNVDPKMASPVKGSRRTEPNVSHITLPAVNVKTFYAGDTTIVESDLNAQTKSGSDQTDTVIRVPTLDDPTDKTISSSIDKFNYQQRPQQPTTSSYVFKTTSTAAAHTQSETSSDYMSVKSTVSVPRINVNSDKNSSQTTNKQGTGTGGGQSSRKETTTSLRTSRASYVSTYRHGKLCMWIVIQKLDDPLMRLSPCFLDYIQQTLNNVSEDDSDLYGTSSLNNSNVNTPAGPNTPQAPHLSSQTTPSTSEVPKVIVSSDTKFPVDVVIAIIIETFEIDIDCYPHDKIACMMLLPQTNIVFSNVRNNLSALEDSDLVSSRMPMQSDFQSSVPPAGKSQSNDTPKRPSFFTGAANMSKNPSGFGKSLSGDKLMADGNAGNPGTGGLGVSGSSGMFCAQTQIGEANGWIVTVVADDFNVFVFHHFKLNNDDPRGMGGMSSFGYSFGDNSRKDAFSLSVKSVRFNMCRNATLHMSNPKESSQQNPANLTAGQNPNQSAFITGYERTARSNVSTVSSNANQSASCERYRFINMSLILDFGECQLKFDIRKLSELRTFVKYWYRQKLIKQAFIAPDPDLALDDLDFSLNQEEGMPQPPHHIYSKPKDSDFTGEYLRRSLGGNMTPVGKSKQHRDSVATEQRRRKSGGPTPNQEDQDRAWSPKTSTLASGSGSRCNTKWESNVIVAANFSSFEVNMQLDSFMGSIKVRTEKLRGTGLLHLTSDRHKIAASKVHLGKSELSSIAATINPSFQLRNWTLQLSLKRPPQEHPEHAIALNLNESEFRMNYKSNPILMGRFNMLKLHFNDTWKVEENPTSQIPCKLLIKADISWDNAQILLVQSTFSDFIIIKARFIHFYNQYFSTVSAESPLTVAKATTGSGPLFQSMVNPRESLESVQTIQKKINWRRHWPGIVSDIVSRNFPFLPADLSSSKVLLSGRVELKGDKLSVVLMENEIRSSRWLVLALQQPLISFSTECQQFEESEVEMLIVEQNLSCQLLHDILSKNDRKRDMQMAEIRLYHRIGDGSCPIMVASAVREWFAHTLKNTNAPNNEDVGARSYYKVESSLIASLPRLQASLTTEQKQTLVEPLLPDSAGISSRRTPSGPQLKPTVDCRFTTTFHQPMQVALDPQYIEIFKKLFKDCNEKIKAATAQSKGGPAVTRKVSKLDDPREYNVVHWIFDPSVKFLTGTASSTDPPGINWLWKKLGIENCKHSLPKFSQRYLMDHLDAVVAHAVLYDIRKLSKLHNQLPDVIQK